MKTNITLIDNHGYMIGGERSETRGITKNVHRFRSFWKLGEKTLKMKLNLNILK